MKKILRYVSLLLASLVIFGCGFINFGGLNLITPSDSVTTETRQVSDFSGIDLSTFGKMVITQGDTVSLTISGADNLVPLVKTTVKNGVLSIEMKENVNITKLNSDNMLTFTITVKDLTGLTVSGAGDVEMDALQTNSLMVVMSGAGQVSFGQLTAQSLNATLSGLGNIQVAGEVTDLVAVLSGAGALEAGDLKCATANVSISGLGGATVWVTDSLTGDISGGGNVSYYGNPQTTFSTSGLGEFKSLGSK